MYRRKYLQIYLIGVNIQNMTLKCKVRGKSGKVRNKEVGGRLDESIMVVSSLTTGQPLGIIFYMQHCFPSSSLQIFEYVQ
jgi:hypothetical protein